MSLKPQDYWFVNAAITLVMFGLLCLIAPPFLVLKLVHTIIRSFYRVDNMEGKVVLITGASSGIGEHLAYEYARKKASLVIVARRESRLREVAAMALKLGSPDVLIVRADVSNVDDCKKFIDQTIKHFSRLDHLVNNAGIGSISTIEDAVDVKSFTPVMDVNFWGSVYPTYFAIPHLKRTKGTVIVNSSAAALVNPPKSSFYNASKAALISFYESLRAELAPSIRITIVTLGFIESEMTQGKHLTKTGSVEATNQLKDELIQSFPVMSTEPCAKAIVEGACRGQRYVTEPQYMTVLSTLWFLCPELFDFYYGTYFLGRKKHT